MEAFIPRRTTETIISACVPKQAMFGDVFVEQQGLRRNKVRMDEWVDKTLDAKV